MTRHVLCMKWGTKYGPHYVNNLYAMARRHLRGDFRFICLTDNTEGIRAEVECFPIPRLDIRPEAAGVVGQADEIEVARQMPAHHAVQAVDVLGAIFRAPLHAKDVALVLLRCVHGI